MVGRVGPIEHARSLRATAMALQAVFVHANRPQPEAPCTIALDVDGQPVAVVLGPSPSVTVGPAARPDAAVRVPEQVLTDYLAGPEWDVSRLEAAPEDQWALDLLLRALGAPVDGR